jgi:hypothetical protein
MAVKPNNLSRNIVQIMQALSKNDGLARLLIHDIDNPFDRKEWDERPSFDKGGYYVQNANGKFILPPIDKNKLVNPKSDSSRIHPYPFDIEATIDDRSFIRVYYNDGDFNDNEVIQEMHLCLDIVVAKNLWLINNGTESLIRPYEIMDRVIDLTGKKSINSTIKINFDGWQHLAVNSKFDAIRLYSNYFSVETNSHSYDRE